MSRSTVAMLALCALVAGGCGLGDPAPAPVRLVLERDRILLVPGILGPGPGAQPERVRLGFTVHRLGYQGQIEVSAVAHPSLHVEVVVDADDVDQLRGALVISATAGSSDGMHHVQVRAAVPGAGIAHSSFVAELRQFELTLYDSIVTVNQGGTNTVRVNAKRPSGIQLSLTVGASPQGVTITPASLQGRWYLDIAAAPNAPARLHPLFVTLKSERRTETRQLWIRVQAPPPTRPIAFRACWSQFIQPIYHSFRYAYRNDGGAWIPVTPDADDYLRFDATERLSFATEFSHPDFYSPGPRLRVIHLTASELEEMQCASAGGGSKLLYVKASNTSEFLLTLGTLSVTQSSRRGAPRAGTHDLIATGFRNSGGVTEHAAIFRRGVDPRDRDTLFLDFNAPEAFAVGSGAIEYASPVLLSTRLHTRTTIASLAGRSTPVNGDRYPALSADLLRDDEIQSVIIRASVNGAGIVRYFRQANPIRPAFGPAVAEPTQVASSNTVKLPVQPEYPDLAGIGLFRILDHRGIYQGVEIWQTKAYADGAFADWTFAIPDMGRFAEVFPVSASDRAIAATAVSGRASLFFGGSPADGAELRWSSRNGYLGYMQNLPFPDNR